MSQTVPMKRISAKRKEETVLRLLQGENINDISRELKISVPEIESWKNRFLIAAREGLKTRGKDPVEKELEIAKKTIGELTMELNLHKKKRTGSKIEKGIGKTGYFGSCRLKIC